MLLAVAFVAQGFAVPTQASAASTAAVPRQTIDQIIPEIDRGFTAFARGAHIPGITWGILKDGRLLHIGASGVQDVDQRRPVTPESLFRIASMSKAFTALAILKLRDEGRLTLDTTAETFVPEMRTWRYPTSDSPRIRVRDLLSHAGGFVTDDPWGDRQQVLSEGDFTAMLRQSVPFTRAPQIAHEYSNFGYALLGRIVTNVSGRPFKDYIEQEIMRPLGMTSTGYDIFAAPQERRAIGYRWENEAWAREPDMRHGTFGAMGGVQTSANDYARWVAYLLSAWPPRDGPEEGPVRRSSVREMAQGLNFVRLSPRPGIDAGACQQAVAYGMGMRAVTDCDVGLALVHGGGYPGYGSYILLLPERGIGIFALSNRTYAGPSGPVWDAAMLLHKTGWPAKGQMRVSGALAAAYRSAGALYRAGNIEPARNQISMNFLMDRSAENWSGELQRLKSETGECRTDAPIVATGALSGNFTWNCERAKLEGQLLLAPTSPPTIQALRLQSVPGL